MTPPQISVSMCTEKIKIDRQAQELSTPQHLPDIWLMLKYEY